DTKGSSAVQAALATHRSTLVNTRKATADGPIASALDTAARNINVVRALHAVSQQRPQHDLFELYASFAGFRPEGGDPTPADHGPAAWVTATAAKQPPASVSFFAALKKTDGAANPNEPPAAPILNDRWWGLAKVKPGAPAVQQVVNQRTKWWPWALC